MEAKRLCFGHNDFSVTILIPLGLRLIQNHSNNKPNLDLKPILESERLDYLSDLKFKNLIF